MAFLRPDRPDLAGVDPAPERGGADAQQFPRPGRCGRGAPFTSPLLRITYSSVNALFVLLHVAVQLLRLKALESLLPFLDALSLGLLGDPDSSLYDPNSEYLVVSGVEAALTATLGLLVYLLSERGYGAPWHPSVQWGDCLLPREESSLLSDLHCP